MSHPLDDYADVLGELSDAEVADLAGCTAEDVAAFRGSTSDDKPRPAADLVAWCRDADDIEGLQGLLEDTRKTVREAAQKRLEVVERVAQTDDEPPRQVRVIAKGSQIVWLEGQRVRIGFRDMYGGDTAALLWKHARDLVEACP